MTRKPAAGYAGKSLADKLGIRAGMRIAAVAAPSDYASLIAPLPRAVTITHRAGAQADVVHYFVARRADLVSRIAALESSLQDDAVLWISWPKRSSGHATDLTEDALREVILPLGLVDVKVCAVDDTWSALKFVRRLQHRR